MSEIYGESQRLVRGLSEITEITHLSKLGGGSCGDCFSRAENFFTSLSQSRVRMRPDYTFASCVSESEVRLPYHKPQPLDLKRCLAKVQQVQSQIANIRKTPG